MYLINVETLYDVALGIYDLPLVLLIAQNSQKDPREYLPFLNSLKKMELNLRKFTIDDHLKKYGKALLWLKETGDENFEKCVEYTKKHSLYKDAMSYYKGEDERYKVFYPAFSTLFSSFCRRSSDFTPTIC